MQGAIILLVLMVLLFAAAAVLKAFAGLLVIAGLGVGFFAFLAALNLVGRK
jgi:hypothetical protein